MKCYRSARVMGSGALVSALNGASFSIASGTTLALVGDSGSGKSTLALCLACLERPTSGRIWFEGRNLAALGEKELRRVRPQIQLIFQDPARSINPRYTALEIVMEPLLVQRKWGQHEVRDRAVQSLERVGLHREMATRRAHEFSGGQRQRLAIARALMLEPRLLILDEALSALDCSVQAQIANLLLDLQSSLGLTYLFITHDPAMAAHLSDEAALMDRGRIVKQDVPQKVLSGVRPGNQTELPPAGNEIKDRSSHRFTFAMHFLFRRLAHAFVLLCGVSILSFLFTSLAPGNYFDEMRLNPQVSLETVAAMRAEYQIDRPLPVRYARWARSVLHGNLGYSFSYNSSVGPLVWVRARNTLFLTVTATLFAWALALPLGVWSARHVRRLPDFLISTTTAGLLVIPDLALALGLLLFAVRSGWFPTGGLVSIDFEGLSPINRLHDLAWHMFLPVFVLVLSFLPMLVRHVRAAMVGVLAAPFLRAARGHGISRRRLLYRYALPAAANPLISLFGFSIGVLLSGSLLVEVVMSWPGLGPFLLEAILSRDLYVVFGGILLSALFLVVGNFIADLFLYRADPRIRPEAVTP
ncbi:MAG TPA: ATP-binding cassette domain-containing protein [Candidatus Sulfotelmatobacter sp.]|nr:ATP-binding cassette domain-containing protein [Candidatus Sulfotelmatobacter sp.]